MSGGKFFELKNGRLSEISEEDAKRMVGYAYRLHADDSLSKVVNFFTIVSQSPIEKLWWKPTILRRVWRKIKSVANILLSRLPRNLKPVDFS